MKRVKWKGIWLVCWTLFLIADMFFEFRTQLSSLIRGAEQEETSVFHHRLQTALLVLFVVVALAPLVWPLARRWFVLQPARKLERIERDIRDASLAEVLSYLIHQSAWGAGCTATEDERLRDAAGVLEEAARKGRLSVRGLPPGGTSRELISTDYWLSAGIDLAATIDSSGTGGQTEARHKERGQKIQVYRALVVARDELMKLWPPDNIWRRTGRATARGLAQRIPLGYRNPSKK